MLGSVIYEVRGRDTSGRVSSYGARRTRPEAETVLAEYVARFARLGHDDALWIEEIDTAGLFTLPSRPAPRERFVTRVTEQGAPGTWPATHVEVLDGDRVVAAYDRNYAMLGTFEPFRQGDRTFALVSPDYTATSVLDLDTGAVVAAETPSPDGFCPVGFYVPDWWDLHDGTVLPGSMSWRPEDHEWPNGDFGFVWGCVWGDDSSWKVQYLDLTDVAHGVIRRDDRFGYVKLATDAEREARRFIRCSSWQGRRRVELVVEQDYELDTGRPIPDDE